MVSEFSEDFSCNCWSLLLGPVVVSPVATISVTIEPSPVVLTRSVGGGGGGVPVVGIGAPVVASPVVLESVPVEMEVVEVVTGITAYS